VRPLRQLRIEARAIIDPRGRLRGRFTASRKLDEIGDLSRALERLTRRMESHLQFIESFAADVSHEFKNPLASIRTATQMLSEVDEPGQRRRFLGMVEQDVARMERLLQGLREISLIDTGLATEVREPVRVDSLLQSIVDGFSLREPKIRFELTGADAPAVVYGSADRLAQVFENLLDNAASFSQPGGAIRVDLRANHGSIGVTISDSGPGIPPQNLDRIFNRFFSYRPDARSGNRHTGLGLAIVKAIVEGYNGTVIAENLPEGGTRLGVHLPGSES
jgi:two-component system, OmpR family, sensor histidine kinase ChvG